MAYLPCEWRAPQRVSITRFNRSADSNHGLKTQLANAANWQLYGGYIGLERGHLGIMEKEMEATIWGATEVDTLSSFRLQVGLSVIRC